MCILIGSVMVSDIVNVAIDSLESVIDLEFGLMCNIKT